MFGMHPFYSPQEEVLYFLLKAGPGVLFLLAVILALAIGLRQDRHRS